ncbi:MAG: EVE domain-containing protein [Rhodobacter sp.]|nr:EVE domain-containing protein [Rhodobacter sp.]MCA3513824.1 EVE domain-containing protein [Rhodobacter sp.]MCA3520438.1 EVE domain-containing protein [Rhodobacter sp.]MCA3523430.1 EVE domain-containing protein [Rhodobacter sp.]MCA3524639.1 EVE domain-containing protein [Rhodobacter sp.]
MANRITVASADHAAVGLAQGFVQVNHDKSAPLRRIRPGDVVAIYSPVQVYGSRDGLQSFTALGRVQPGEPCQGRVDGGFCLFRRDVAWWPARPVRICLLRERLSFTAGKTNRGAPLRFGLLRVEDADMAVIAAAMGAAAQLSG